MAVPGSATIAIMADFDPRTPSIARVYDYLLGGKDTHETAQAIIPDARVAYIDNDPVVLAHLRALAEHGNPGVTVVDGDVRESEEIVAAIAGDIPLKTPACLLMGYLLHFFPPDAARDLVASYVARLAPESYGCSSGGVACSMSSTVSVRSIQV